MINEEFENLLAFKSFEIKVRILSSETQNADAELKKIGGEKRKERKIEGKIVKENNKDSKLSNETNNGDEEVETKEGEDNEEKKLGVLRFRRMSTFSTSTESKTTVDCRKL